MDNDFPIQGFVPFFQGDSNKLTPQGQQLMKLAGKYGSLTNVIPTPMNERSPGGLGFMSFNDPQSVRVDPTQAGIHTAAHEIMHSSFPTKVGLDQMNLIMNPEARAQKLLRDNPGKASGPAQLRYLHETGAIPTMLEEAHAQGGARKLTEQLGYGNIDQGFPVPGGFIPQTLPDGSVDSLAYPLMYRDKGINAFMRMRGVGEGNSGMIDGAPLGIGIDPRFTPEEREEYYRITDNARSRAQRMFNEAYNRFK